MSAIADCVVVPSDEKPPEIEPYLIECKFTIESREGLGGDWEKNMSGATKDKRITFEGCATKDLYGAVMDALRNISSS